MPEPDRAVLKPASLKHPRVREFLAAKRHPLAEKSGYQHAVQSPRNPHKSGVSWVIARGGSTLLPPG